MSSSAESNLKNVNLISALLAALTLSVMPVQAIIICPGSSIVPGIDVSEVQGAIDWNGVGASGVQFAFARAADGLREDALFDQNYAAMQVAGLIRGAYQFFEPRQDPAQQAALLLAKIGSLGMGDLPPVLDVEVTGGQSPAVVAEEIQTWVSTVQAAIGRPPIIYTSPAIWAGLLSSPPSFGTLLWIANWNVSCPTVPSSWSTWTFWQHADNGSVPGIGFVVDLDEFNGSATDLENLAANYSVCPLYDQTKAVHSGATVPIRFELCDGNGTDLSSESIPVNEVSVTQLSNNVFGEVVDTSSDTPDTSFRFDSTLGTAGGYILNLSTKGLATGTYAVNFIAGADSKIHSVQFDVR
jgi:lysozyme